MKLQLAERERRRQRAEEHEEPPGQQVAPGKVTWVEQSLDEKASGAAGAASAPAPRGDAAARAQGAASWPADASLQAAMGLGQGAVATHEPALQYLLVHSAAVARAVAAMLREQARGWPQPAPEVPWRDPVRFTQRVQERLCPVIRDDAEALFTLVSPASPAEAYQRQVAGAAISRTTYLPGFGAAIAMQVRQALVESIARLGARLQEVAQAHGVVRRDAIAAAHPLDSYVRSGLLLEGVLEIAIEDHGAASPRQAPPVTVRWMGKRDPLLWNYVEVTPASASVEQVAAALWGSPAQSRMAFALSRHGSLVEVAPHQARELIAQRYPGEVVSEHNPPAGAGLARSPLADGLALAQVGEAAGPAPSQRALTRLHGDIGALLERLRDAVEPLGLQGELAPAFAFRARSFAEVMDGDEATRRRWLPVWHAQHLHLQRLVAALAPQLAAARQAKAERWAKVAVQEAREASELGQRYHRERQAVGPGFARAHEASFPKRADRSARERAKAADARDPARERVRQVLRAVALSHLSASAAAATARLAAAERRALVDSATDTLIGLREAAN